MYSFKHICREFAIYNHIIGARKMQNYSFTPYSNSSNPNDDGADANPCFARASEVESSTATVTEVALFHTLQKVYS